MKKRKVICIITIIVLSVLYAAYAWIGSVFGLMLLSLSPGQLSIAQIYLIASGVLLLLGPVFGVAGIVLSIVQLRKEKYAAAFVVQFLPVFTTVHAVLFLLASVFFGNTN